jgi:hypothetical protein
MEALREEWKEVFLVLFVSKLVPCYLLRPHVRTEEESYSCDLDVLIPPPPLHRSARLPPRRPTLGPAFSQRRCLTWDFESDCTRLPPL